MAPWVPFKSLLRVQIKRVIYLAWIQSIFFLSLQIKREKHMHIILFKRQLYLGTYFRPTRDLSIQTVSIWLAMVKFGRQLIFSGQPTAVHYGNIGCQVFNRGLKNQIYFCQHTQWVLLRQYCLPFSDVSGNTYLLFGKDNIGWTPDLILTLE